MKTLLIATIAALSLASVAMLATAPDDVQVKRQAEYRAALAKWQKDPGSGPRPTPPRPTKGLLPLVWVTDPNPLRDAQVSTFNRLHPNYDLRIDPGNGGKEKIIVQSAAGVGPDLFDYWGQNDRDAYIDSGVAWDVTDELAKRGFDWRKEIWPLAQPWISRNDRLYAIPANVGSDAIWFRRDWFREEGIPEPRPDWSVGEMIETAKRLTKPTPDGKVRYGMLIDFAGAYRHWLPSFEGSLFSKDGTEITVDSPESIACVTLCRDLVWKYKVTPNQKEEAGLATQGGQFGGAGPLAYFRQEYGAMAIGGRWWLAQMRGDVRTRGFELGVADMPIAKVPKFDGGTRAVMVNSKSPRRQQALDFLLFLAGPEYNVLLNDQADALSGGRKYAYTDRYMRNPEFPEERQNDVWRKAVERGVVLEYTPFMPVADVDNPLYRHLDLIKLNKKTPEQGMRDAAAEMRRSMKLFLQRNPKIRERYEAAIAARRAP